MQDIIPGDWRALRRAAGHEWSRLSEEQLDAVDGRRDRLARVIRDTYEVSLDEADKQIAAWESSLADAGAGDEHPVLDNEGPETGDDDRPGGRGLPSNQGGGREPVDGTRH